MYTKGDRVAVEGLHKRTATLRVWDIKERGLLLCTDKGYEFSAMTGEEPIAVGFPWADIKGLVEDI